MLHIVYFAGFKNNFGHITNEQEGIQQAIFRMFKFYLVMQADFNR